MASPSAQSPADNRFLAVLMDDRGSAAVSFILTLPIFLSILAIVVQYALLANARLVVEHACHMAARSAETSLPDEHPEYIHRAACLTLTAISPQASSNASSEAQAMYTAMRDCGTGVSNSFAGRYTYASDATQVTWDAPSGDFLHANVQEIDVTVRYRFKLTVPVANKLLAGQQNSVAGVQGRFYDLTSTRKVLVSPGRRTLAGNDGWPQN